MEWLQEAAPAKAATLDNRCSITFVVLQDPNPSSWSPDFNFHASGFCVIFSILDPHFLPSPYSLSRREWEA